MGRVDETTSATAAFGLGVPHLDADEIRLLGSAAAENLVKGRRIAVEGSLRQDTYEKDGEERRSVTVVARRVEYL